jgi:hypothetical protein
LGNLLRSVTYCSYQTGTCPANRWPYLLPLTNHTCLTSVTARRRRRPPYDPNASGRRAGAPGNPRSRDASFPITMHFLCPRGTVRCLEPQHLACGPAATSRVPATATTRRSHQVPPRFQPLSARPRHAPPALHPVRFDHLPRSPGLLGRRGGQARRSLRHARIRPPQRSEEAQRRASAVPPRLRRRRRPPAGGSRHPPRRPAQSGAPQDAGRWTAIRKCFM